jgi:very-short-patch-repair endonuclease
MSNAQIASQFFKSMGLPAPVLEYKFHPTRKWRFDYAWPELRIALEVEGGVWTGGRHTRGSGFLKDVKKYNAAAALGWRVLRCTPSELMTLATAEILKEASLA